jgi:uncharacterized protein HemY
MTDKPAIGKNVWDGALVDGRNATSAARQALDRLIEEQPGPQTTALLIAKVAVQLGKIEAVLNQLDEIGRNAKNGTKRTLKKE